MPQIFNDVQQGFKAASIYENQFAVVGYQEDNTEILISGCSDSVACATIAFYFNDQVPSNQLAQGIAIYDEDIIAVASLNQIKIVSRANSQSKQIQYTTSEVIMLFSNTQTESTPHLFLLTQQSTSRLIDFTSFTEIEID